MLSRLQARILIFGIVLMAIMAIIGLMGKYAPDLFVAIALIVAMGAVILIVGTTVVAVAITAVLPPRRPFAEVSILGKHVSDLSKLLVRLLAFFGNTALAWIVALNVAFQTTGTVDIMSIPNQLWGIFLSLAALIAYAYWLRIPVDLLRTRKTGRLRGIAVLTTRWLRPRIASVRLERFIARASGWLVGEAWSLFYVLCLAPLVIIATGGTLITMARHR